MNRSPQPDSRQLAAVSTAFDAVAAVYDRAWTDSLVGRRQREQVWHAIQGVFPADGRVLELGCGTGTDAAHLARSGLRVHATDASPEMLRLARSTLAPGGRLSLALPDWGAHVADYIDRQQRVPLRAPSIAGGMFRPEVNVMLNILYNWGHQMVYDEEMLRLVLDAAGWAKAAITHPDGANLVVEAVKID